MNRRQARSRTGRESPHDHPTQYMTGTCHQTTVLMGFVFSNHTPIRISTRGSEKHKLG
ncbi:hypothetical protein RSAG8_07591, partial [Rhizoctonia solani AG-8 WAC10335]